MRDNDSFRFAGKVKKREKIRGGVYRGELCFALVAGFYFGSEVCVEKNSEWLIQDKSFAWKVNT